MDDFTPRIILNVEEGGEVRQKVLFWTHSRQDEFFDAIFKYRFTCFGGARSGGKSKALRWALFYLLLWHLQEGRRNVVVGLFCATHPELWKRQIQPWLRDVAEAAKVLGKPIEYIGTYNAQHKEFRLSDHFGGGIIAFCNMQDMTSYQSAEFAAIAVDEITLCADREILTWLQGSLRWPGVNWCPFFCATNPTGPGHGWVKRLWITKDFSSEADRKLDPEQFHFVRSLPTDNPFIDESYREEQLEKMPEHFRKPWLEGSWDIVAGQRFDRFREYVHCVDPFDIRELGPVKYFRSVDIGFYDPMACGWYGVVKVEPEWPKDPGIRAFKMHEHVEAGLNAREQAKRILEVESSLKSKDYFPSDMKIETTFLDDAAWAADDDGLSCAQKFFNEGIDVEQALKARAPGWDALADMIYWEHQPGERPEDFLAVKRAPILKFFKPCIVTISQIQDAMWDPKKGYDILTPRSEGHHWDALDETRYFCLTHLRPPSETEQQTWAQKQVNLWNAMQRSERRQGGRANRGSRVFRGRRVNIKGIPGA